MGRDISTNSKDQITWTEVKSCPGQLDEKPVDSTGLDPAFPSSNADF